MIPATRLVWLVGAGVLLAIPAALARLLQWSDDLLLPLLAWDAGVVALALVDLALSRPPPVEGRREVPDVLSVGRPNPVALELRQSGRRRLVLRVHDDGAEAVLAEGLPPEVVLPARGTVTVRYHLRPERRGPHALGGVWLRAPSPLGLWWRQVRLPLGRQVRVYPDLQAVRTYEKLVREARDERFTRATRRRGGESEFERLREYTPDDDVRRIDWRATARRGVTIAREYQLERNQNVVFVLDLGRLMTAQSRGPAGTLSHLDHALNATLMLGHVSLRAGDHVGLAAFDSGLRRFLPPEGGPQAARRLIQATYDLFPSLVEPDFRLAFTALRTRLRKRSLVVLFTQVLDPARQHELVPLVRSLVPTHLPLCVLFRDEDVESLLQPPTTGQPGDGPDTAAAYTAAAAAAEVLWRERLVEAMRRAGAHVLHVRPQELTQQLIAQYLEIKARQWL